MHHRNSTWGRVPNGLLSKMVTWSQHSAGLQLKKIMIKRCPFFFFFIWCFVSTCIRSCRERSLNWTKLTKMSQTHAPTYSSLLLIRESYIRHIGLWISMVCFAWCAFIHAFACGYGWPEPLDHHHCLYPVWSCRSSRRRWVRAPSRRSSGTEMGCCRLSLNQPLTFWVCLCVLWWNWHCLSLIGGLWRDNDMEIRNRH